ncbi:MAG: LacI family transcriptional regulator [Oscillospiraceae bacterium]|jgi:LacI family transcriptional regulator|nr:LacI family transcriptional regulator [Oscillospiraceae bacterium]MCI1990907.1 LacI family transcriptional regulator [Oscillospiraceae bacterium]MCI2034410.1 LacI family transcriptional regulator [Oscillospiraceae bacterium]
MTTIRDIAEKLNLSVSTVSKGLNGASDVSDETRRLVLDTALKMGYAPKQARAAAPYKICVFIENMGYERIEQFGYDIIVGFRLAAAAKQWDVSIVPMALNEGSGLKYEEFMRANRYAAGFLLGFVLHDDFLRQLEKTTVPTVLLDNVIYNRHVACVGVDNQQGIFCAVQHLAELGHTSIAMLNGEPQSRVSGERLSGFRLGMEHFGLPVRKELIGYGDYTADCAGKFVDRFVEAGATAIVCASDRIAHGAMRELSRLGLRVPDDVSVVGFDDLPIAAYATPPLTTVRQDRLAIGRNVCLLLEQLMQGNCINRLLLMPELVVRESTGKPKNSSATK